MALYNGFNNIKLLTELTKSVHSSSYSFAFALIVKDNHLRLIKGLVNSVKFKSLSNYLIIFTDIFFELESN